MFLQVFESDQGVKIFLGKPIQDGKTSITKKGYRTNLWHRLT